MISRIRRILAHRHGQAVESQAGNHKPTAKRFDRCVLHIGTEKTGTSTIQRFMSNNRAAFAREGVIYPSSTGGEGGSQWGFVACANDRAWQTDIGIALGIRSEAEQVLYGERLRDQLEQEFATIPNARSLVISSEHFHSRLRTKDAVSQLKEFLAPWVEAFEVVLYLRRQDRMAVSFYSTQIKSGNTSLILFPETPKGPLPYIFDYDRIFDNWATVFGFDAMRTRLFELGRSKEPDLLRDFCMATGLRYEGKMIPFNENEGLNRQGAEFILEMNRQLPCVVDGRRNEQRDALMRRVSELCRGKHYPATREAARNFYSQFIQSNERLKDKLFPKDPEPLFDDDFSEYPEELEQMAPRYEDAVGLAIRIWMNISNGGK